MSVRPPFDALPLRKDGPPGNAWGLYGDNDELGALNLLTPENTALAAKEIADGVRVSVDLQLGHLTPPCFGRAVFEHRIWLKEPRTVHDDSVNFNTQCSSQWDGFRHYAYQDAKLFYNGRTAEDIASSDVIGIHKWVDKGGIVGRGVLLDYAAWADSKGINIEAFRTTAISISTLKEVAAAQGTSFRNADILFIRTGYGRAYNQMPVEERQVLAQTNPPPAIGLEESEETVRWVWESGFAALVGDHPSMEAWPVQNPQFCLHEWTLAGWGMPLGELFDLETLSKECSERNRWSFFFSSVPLKVPGGVGSPPCGVAIF